MPARRRCPKGCRSKRKCLGYKSSSKRRSGGSSSKRGYKKKGSYSRSSSRRGLPGGQSKATLGQIARAAWRYQRNGQSSSASWKRAWREYRK